MPIEIKIKLESEAQAAQETSDYVRYLRSRIPYKRVDCCPVKIGIILSSSKPIVPHKYLSPIMDALYGKAFKAFSQVKEVHLVVTKGEYEGMMIYWVRLGPGLEEAEELEAAVT